MPAADTSDAASACPPPELVCCTCACAVLVDPQCGSGTFLIEGALLATNTAPGSFRRSWPFMQACVLAWQRNTCLSACPACCRCSETA
jgi:hypothetical protein